MKHIIHFQLMVQTSEITSKIYFLTNKVLTKFLKTQSISARQTYSVQWVLH